MFPTGDADLHALLTDHAVMAQFVSRIIARAHAFAIRADVWMSEKS